MEGTDLGGEQQFCLRWNNFQANITSQFEALRDDEDFVDVTLACEGHRLEAHKVVLSACSPYFKELFKNNPCPHPIIFMRDCELVHIAALLEFMYAGEVNISQAQLSSFLKTAEALQIRGLTDSSEKNETKTPSVKHQSSQLRNLLCGRQQTSPAKDICQNAIETKDTYQKTVKHYSQSRKAARNLNDSTIAAQSFNGISDRNVFTNTAAGSNNSKFEFKDTISLSDNGQNEVYYKISEGNQSNLNDSDMIDTGNINPFAIGNVNSIQGDYQHEMLEPKLEIPDYPSDEDIKQEKSFNAEGLFSADGAQLNQSFLNLQGDIAGTSQDVKNESDVVVRRESGGNGGGRVCCAECGRRYSNLSNLRQHVRLIHRSQPVACPLCSRSFKTQLYLRRHTLSQHSNVQHNDKNVGSSNIVRNMNIIRTIPLSKSSIVNNKNQNDNKMRDHAILTPIVNIPQMIKIHTLPALNSIIKKSTPKVATVECPTVNGNIDGCDNFNGDVVVSSPDSIDEDMIELVEDDVTDET